MLVVPFSYLLIARNPIRLRLLLPLSAARVTRLAMSTTPPAAAATISVEYAKSGRSTCKGCSEAIASGALRLGASARDPRGFDATKWYHVSCLPSSSHPLGPIESIKGFDSIKDHDREELRELEKNHKRGNTAVSPLEEPSPMKARIQTSSPAEGVPDKNYKSDGNVADELNESNMKKEIAHSMEDSKEGADKDLEGVKVHCMGESEEGAEKNLEEAKLPAGNRPIGPSISFSLSDIKKEYKDATLPAHWKVFDTVIFCEQEDGLHASSKIAAFDFDGCLAKTSVRRVGADQWSLQHKSILEKLQRLYNDGYKLVIFTNESNIERHKNKRQQAVDSKVGRLDNFIECVKAPIQVFIACGLGKGKNIPDDPYRKPNPGMWWLMAQHFNSGIEIDMDQSFYVGDAAGRDKDHSDADIKFAKAIGLKFHVPEEYFGC
ncbi:polynucleotide 3'-phosphatase ZDP-like isoform X2 [Miscanthus floridulus]|uniref:polynucleotide 3'-phosphatase ZDP-like isoform X2 n=1 Tax=Miscanthus floridulus TaxID=154761 RepID=UPI003458FF90